MNKSHADIVEEACPFYKRGAAGLRRVGHSHRRCPHPFFRFSHRSSLYADRHAPAEGAARYGEDSLFPANPADTADDPDRSSACLLRRFLSGTVPQSAGRPLPHRDFVRRRSGRCNCHVHPLAVHAARDVHDADLQFPLRHPCCRDRLQPRPHGRVLEHHRADSRGCRGERFRFCSDFRLYAAERERPQTFFFMDAGRRTRLGMGFGAHLRSACFDQHRGADPLGLSARHSAVRR